MHVSIPLKKYCLFTTKITAKIKLRKFNNLSNILFLYFN